MRHLYRLAQGLPIGGVMLSLLRAKPDPMQDTMVEGVDELGVYSADGDDARAKGLPALKKLALGIMQMVEGSALGDVTLVRLAPKANLQLPTQNRFACHLVVLHASVASRVMAGDEATQVQAGEAWWLNTSQDGSRIINAAGAEDELVVLIVDVRVEA